MSSQASLYQAPEDLLKERVIVVTGAGDGIGRQAALSFAQHGATVILLGRTLAKLESVYDQIEQAGLPQPAIYPINFEGAVSKDYDDLAVTLQQTFGRVDGLLHNAALLGQRSPLSHYDIDMWQQLLQVNVTAPFLLTQALMPLLEASSNASVLFTSTGVAEQGKAFWGAYAMSKAAQNNMMQTWADEVEGIANIRINSLDPGSVSTRMRASAFPAEDPQSIATTSDIMPSYLYLMGPESNTIHGQIIHAQ